MSTIIYVLDVLIHRSHMLESEFSFTESQCFILLPPYSQKDSETEVEFMWFYLAGNITWYFLILSHISGLFLKYSSFFSLSIKNIPHQILHQLSIWITNNFKQWTCAYFWKIKSNERNDILFLQGKWCVLFNFFLLKCFLKTSISILFWIQLRHYAVIDVTWSLLNFT